MLLTPIGEALLPHARLLQREADSAIDEINALRGLAKGTIKVGAIGSVASLVLPLAIGRVLQRWPNLRVRSSRACGTGWRALAGHEIDLALDVEQPESDEIAPIADCRWQRPQLCRGGDGASAARRARALAGRHARPALGIAAARHRALRTTAAGVRRAGPGDAERRSRRARSPC